MHSIQIIRKYRSFLNGNRVNTLSFTDSVRLGSADQYRLNDVHEKTDGFRFMRILILSNKGLLLSLFDIFG